MLTDQAAGNPVSYVLAVVPTEAMLAGIAVQVLAADPVPDADDRSLEQTKEALDGIHVPLSTHKLAPRMVDDMVALHLAPDPAVGRQFVGRQDGLTAAGPFPKQRRDVVDLRRGDPGSSGFTASLDGSEQHRLLGAAAPSGTNRAVSEVARLATDIAFVGLDDAGQRQILAAIEQRTDTVAEEPGRFLRDTELLAELDAADSLGAGKNQIHGEIPGPQREAAVFHRRADRDAEILPAIPAPIDARSLRYRSGVIDCATTVTDGAMRPAHTFQVSTAGFFCAITGEEGGQLHNGAYGHRNALCQ